MSDGVGDHNTVRLEDGELEQLLPHASGVPRRLGDFDLLEEIGRGGMGIVFRAVQRSLDRTVALKVLPAVGPNAAAGVERFKREAAAIASLVHEHIVAIHTFGAEPGWVYFAMDYIMGESLEVRLRQGPLTIEGVLEIAIQVTRALEAAHAAGILHRDIKPGNILLGTDDTSLRARVADFGLAKWIREGEDGQILGTPEYMSPEQAQGRPLSPATDIYSLGALLFHILAGRPPFVADDPLEVLALHQLEPAPDLRQLDARIPFELGAIVMRCLAKREDQRYGSMTALRAALGVFRSEYSELRQFLSRDGQDTEKLVLDALQEHGATSAYKQGLRYSQATVLVADLENFLRLAVTLRPTRVTRLLERFYGELRRVIEASHGTVVALFGDTVLATFGDPIPLEDHGDVALDCALELQRLLADLSHELQPPISVRIGLESGLLLAGYVHDGRQRRYHAYGDPVVVAHALERSASRSEILVGPTLQQATREAFAFAEAGRQPVTLRGLRRELRVSRLGGRS